MARFGQHTISKILLIAVLVIPGIAWGQPITGSGAVAIQDEGVDKGRARSLNCVGAGITCDTTGGTATISVSGAAGGNPAFTDITTGTNAAPLHVGTGGTLDTSGTGTITANRTPCTGTDYLKADGTCAAAGGGSSAFNALTSGTNTTAAMVVGSGASLGTSGTGTVTANRTPCTGTDYLKNDGTCAAAGAGSGDLTEVQATAPLTVTSGTGPIPVVDCPNCVTAYNAKKYSAVGDGATDDRGALNTLANTTMAGSGTIFFPAGTYLIGSAMNFPSGITLKFERGAKLKAATGAAVTIQGHIEASPRDQIFSWAGTGTIKFIEAFASNNVYWVYWWGVVPDVLWDQSSGYYDALDSTAALQMAIDSVPNESILKVLPQSKIILGTSTTTGGYAITLSNRAGIAIVSDMTMNMTFGAANAAQFLWNGAGGTMFYYDHVDHPTIRGIVFSVLNTHAIDGFINFDSPPAGDATATHIGSAGLVEQSSFNAVSNGTVNFKAISIGATSVNNQENYIIRNSSFANGPRSDLISVTGVITAKSTTVTSTGAFVAGDAGKQILLSWADGNLDTTIATYVDANTITLAVAPTVSQTGVTMHKGRALGIGIYQGNTLNALNEQYLDNIFYWLSTGIYVTAGGAHINGVSGFGNDTDIFVQNEVGEMLITNLQTENSLRSIHLNNPIGPIEINGDRGSNGNQRADGWIAIYNGSEVTIRNSRVNFQPPDNSVWLGQPGGAGTKYLTLINNNLSNISTYAKTGLAALDLSQLVFLNNTFNPEAGVPRNKITGFGGDSALDVYHKARNTYGNPVYGLRSEAAVWINPNGGGATPNEFIGLWGLSGAGSNDAGTGDFFGVRGELKNVSQARYGVTVDAKQGSSLFATGVTAFYSFRALGPTTITDGPLPNNYGLYIGPHKITNVTNGWGVYQVGATDVNYFEGNLRLNYLTASRPVITDASKNLASGTYSGNTTRLATMDASTPATNDCAKFDVNLNLTTAGAACGSGGSGGTAGSPLYVQTATATAVTAASETTIIGSGAGTLTIPAAWFTSAGTVLDVHFSGKYSTGAVPGTLNLKLKFGTTAIGQTGAFTPLISVTDGVYSAWVRLVARTIGATGTILVTDIVPFTGATLTPGEVIFSNPTLGTAVTVDTTGTNVVDLTATWGTGATNSITGMTFEMVGPGSAVSSVFGRTGAVVAAANDYAFSQISGSATNAQTTATSANTASAIVARDASGNFTAGTITAALTGNATTATTASGVAANSVALGTDTTGNYVSSATASQGLVLTGTEGASLGLIACTNGQILKNVSGTSWACAADADTGGSGLTHPQAMARISIGF